MSLSFVQFCDDIRQENNGKWILIGCYGNDMTVGGFPFSSQIAAFVTTEVSANIRSMTALYELASGARFATLQMQIEDQTYAGEPTRAQIPLPPFTLQLSSPDTVILKLGFDGEEPREVGRLKVELAVSSQAQSSVPQG